MHKTMTTITASIATAMLLISSPARATVYGFTFESFDGALTASGEMSVNADDEVTAISGAISGLIDQTIASVIPIRTFPVPPIAPTVRSSTTTCTTRRGWPSTSMESCSRPPRIPAATGICGRVPPAPIRCGNRPMPTTTRLRRAGP
jgi:hypothetical protein